MILLSLASFFFAIGLANALFWPRVRKAPLPGSRLRMTVCIPARNEEANLGACLASVLMQGECVEEVLVYDDHSSDRTATVAGSTGDARVRVLAPFPLPEGWYGKTFACAALARETRSEWFLFLDADARLAPKAALRMLAEVELRRLTFLSCWPEFEVHSAAERILMPMLNFVVFSIFPGPMSPWRRDPSLGLAHGACILVERAAYARVGGHHAVHNQIFEDTRLAQLWRRAKERGLCLDGRGVVRVRMYATFGEIFGGFTKNFYRAFQRPLNFWVFLALHFCVFLLPFLIADWRTVGVVLALRVTLALRFGQGWWSVLAHPLAEATVLAIGIASWRAARSKAGVVWKGREYPVARP